MVTMVALEEAVATVARELTDTWETKLALLLAFRAREGHCAVPLRHVEQAALTQTLDDGLAVCEDLDDAAVSVNEQHRPFFARLFCV